jgi:hypothetical protein
MTIAAVRRYELTVVHEDHQSFPRGVRTGGGNLNSNAIAQQHELTSAEVDRHVAPGKESTNASSYPGKRLAFALTDRLDKTGSDRLTISELDCVEKCSTRVDGQTKATHVPGAIDVLVDDCRLGIIRHSPRLLSSSRSKRGFQLSAAPGRATG